MFIEFDYNEGLLCPRCRYGIIRGFYPSPTIYTYDSGKSRLETSSHMICPYCGERSLVSPPGYIISYNFNKDNLLQEPITVVDL